MRPSAEFIEAAAGQLAEWVSDRQAVFTERDLVAHVSSFFPDGAATEELVRVTREMLLAAQRSGQVLTVLPHAESGLILPDGVALSAEELEIAVGQGPGWIVQSGAVRFRALPGEPPFTTRLQLEREEEVLRAVATRSPVTPDPATLDRAIADRAMVEGQAQAMR